MNENDYLDALKSGNQFRIKYDKKIYDCCEDEGWWSEELWSYDKTLDLFKCHYPKSSYKEDFYTCHTEREMKGFIRDAIWSFKNGNGDAARVTNMFLEQYNTPVNTSSIRELAKQKIDSMTDDELRKMFLIF